MRPPSSPASGRSFVCLSILVGLVANPAVAATLRVGSGQDYSTIRAAIGAASGGDTILVEAGTYSEQIGINKRLELICSDPGQCRIRGQRSGGSWDGDYPGCYAIASTVRFGIGSAGSVFRGFFAYPASPMADDRNHFVLCADAAVLVDDVTIDSGTDAYVRMHEDDIRLGGIAINAEQVEVANSRITRMSLFGIKILKDGSCAYIHDNLIRPQFSDSVRIDAHPNRVEANLIMDNELGGSYVGDGVQTNASDYKLKIDNEHNMIIGNRIVANAENSIDLKGAAHSWVEGNLLQGSLGDNDGQTDGVTQDYGTSAISCGTNANNRHSVVINNVVYDSNGGIGRQGDHHRYGNNTSLGNNRNYYGPNREDQGTGRIGLSPGWHTHGVIINNLIGGNNHGEIMLHDTSDLLIDNNFYTTDARDPRFVYKRGDKVDVYDFAGWRSFLSGRSGVSGEERHSAIGNARFASVNSKPVGAGYTFTDFGLRAESPAVDGGRPNTRVADSGGGSGKNLPVHDAVWFRGPNGNPRAPLVKIYVDNDGAADFEARILEVDYDNNRLRLDADHTWDNDAGVYICPRGACFAGRGPDIGAVELGAGPDPECDDGIDNDGDGQTDLADDGCETPAGRDESNCGDGVCEGSERCGSCDLDCGVCPQEKVYTVPRTATPVHIDGVADEFGNAPAITLENERGTAGSYRMMWDDHALYVAASVADADLNAEQQGRDGDLWLDDSVELLFDADHDRGGTMASGDYKFFVSITGVQLDLQGVDRDWDIPFGADVSLVGQPNDSQPDGGYVIEISLPWAAWDVGPPADGEVFGFDLNQNDRNDAGERMVATWSNSSGGSINDPDGWGQLVFSSELVDVGGPDPDGGPNDDGAGGPGADGGDPGAYGEPACANGSSACAGVCVDLQTSPAHCGSCDLACEPGQVCYLGECGFDCGPGAVLVNGVCGPIVGVGWACSAPGRLTGPGGTGALLALSILLGRRRPRS